MSIPLGIFVRGSSEPASAAAVEIIGLPGGWALSAGRPLGNHWRVPVAKLSGAAIFLPRHFSGAVDFDAELRLADDTLVERRSVHLAVTDPDHGSQKSILPTVRAERDISVACRAPRLAAGPGDPRAILVARAERLLAEHDISSARLLLRWSAEAGNARAALLLGETYDACSLYPLHCGADPDRATARTWYEMAAQCGSVEARWRLDRFSSVDLGWRPAKSWMAAMAASRF